jgi:hypothetical protein
MDQFPFLAVTAIILGGFIRFIFLKKVTVSTPSMAAVMAAGIFLFASLPKIPWLSPFSKELSAVLFATWFWIGASILYTVFKGDIYKKHFEHPIKMFAVGTWVAGTSVLTNVLLKYFTDLGFLPAMLAAFNTGLWIVYLIFCLKNYVTILSGPLKDKIHGVVLLATVSTQSLVLLWNNIYPTIMTPLVDRTIIALGILFYLIGFILIARRFFFNKGWSLEDDWTNTNCIIHGAISITGLAQATTHAFPAAFTWVLWTWVFVWFIVVELLEVYRAKKRIAKYGVKSGLFHYDVTQWSRNFTFGMFYAFTIQFEGFGVPILGKLHALVAHYGYWLVFLFIFIETVLFLVTQVDPLWYSKNKRHREGGMLY